MFYLIYKITNTVNGKIYIGSHKTKNIDDDYMGSGKYLLRAIEKHGRDKFTKEILFVFDNAADMYAKEAEIVNDDFLAEENTYNLKRGGFGGWDYVNTNGLSPRPAWTDAARIAAKAAIKKIPPEYYSNRTKMSWHGLSEKEKQARTKNARLAAMSEESTSKRIRSLREIGHQQGEKNSQFGTIWVNHPERGNKKIKKEALAEYLSAGFVRGRKV